MKRMAALLSLVLARSVCYAQDVVRWHFSTKKIADKTYELHFTPTVKSPWHIYSLEVYDDMALPTSFYFNKNSLVSLEGMPKEIGIQKDFVQVVKLKCNVKTAISGEIEFMACTDTQCLPPKTVNFSVKLE